MSNKLDSPAPVVSDNRWRRGLYVVVCLGLLAIPTSVTLGLTDPYNTSFYSTVLFAAILAVGILIAVFRKAVVVAYTPFFAFLAVWLMAKLFTSLTSTYPYASFWGKYGGWSDSLTFAMAVSVIAAVIITLRLGTRRIVRLVTLLTAEAVVLSGITVYMAVTEGFFHQKVRPPSPIGNADFFISYVLLFLPVLVVLLVSTARRRRWLQAAACGFGTLVISMALFVSLPTHLQTIMLPAFMNGKKDVSGISDTNKTITAGNFTQDNQNTERWTEWRVGLALGAERPLVGTGPGTTGMAFFAAKSGLNLTNWNDAYVADRPHNDLIEQFSQEGILGLLAYLALLFGFVWIVLSRRRLIDPAARPWALGLGIGLFLWFGFNQVIFTTVAAGIVAFAWIALLLTMAASARPIAAWWPRLLLIPIALIMLVAGHWAVHYYADDLIMLTGLRMNAKLANGGPIVSGTPAGKRQLLSAEAMTAAAASDMPNESYYNLVAAEAAIDAYAEVKFPKPQDSNIYADKALRFARQGFVDTPYSPPSLLALGCIELYLAPPGSAEEQDGLAQIDSAIDLQPNDVDPYATAAQFAVLKGDDQLALKYVFRGQNAVTRPADKKQLIDIAMSISAPQ